MNKRYFISIFDDGRTIKFNDGTFAYCSESGEIVPGRWSSLEDQGRKLPHNNSKLSMPPVLYPKINECEDKAVTHPQHYNKTKFEVWDVLDEWFPTEPLLWQAVKYIARALFKGNSIQDIQKAINYLERWIVKETMKSEVKK